MLNPEDNKKTEEVAVEIKTPPSDPESTKKDEALGLKLAQDTNTETHQVLDPAASEKMRNFTIKEVKTPEDMAEWLPTFKQIFTDPGDMEPDENFYKYLEDGTASFYTFMEDGKPVGMQMMKFSSDGKTMYIPYCGMIESHRNLNIYPKIHNLIEEEAKKRGIKHTLLDLEDPNRMENLMKGHEDEDSDTVKQRALGRLNFWRRVDYIIVDEPEVAYMRPASDDDQKIQAYDVMAIRAADTMDSEKWDKIFNKDRTAISKEAYEDFYLEMMKIECGQKSKDQLREEFPAIDLFFKNLEKFQGKWVRIQNIKSKPIKPNKRPAIPSKLELA